MVISGTESDVILPAPSEKNPIPSLVAALRLDNQEQLLNLLQQQCTGSQMFVFATESLRTLLMRQVLSDPHKQQRTWNNASKQNWDAIHSYPNITMVPNLKLSATAIVGHVEEIVGIDTVTYFLRPTNNHYTHTIMAAKTIAQWKTPTTQHRMVFLPHTPAIVEKILADTGLRIGSQSVSSTTKTNTQNVVTVHSLQLDLFPLETDVISMEFPDAHREIVLEQTPSTVITDTARSLLKLQDVIGPIRRIQSYGNAAEMVLKKLLDLSVQEYFIQPSPTTSTAATTEDRNNNDDVAALVIIDRNIDMVTPMVTPLTYEGLLDEVVGLECGFLGLDVNIINPPDEVESVGGTTTTNSRKPLNEGSRVALAVNDSDGIFAEIRNQHVEKFGSFLQNQAKALKAVRNDFTETGKQKNLDELRKFVKNIPDLNKHFRLLGNHIHLAELVKKASEESSFRERWQMERAMMEGELCYDQLEDLLLAHQNDPLRFFRLLCLQSICKNGINSSRYDSLRRDVVQTYGYEYLFVLTNLEKAGLLRRKEAFLGIDKPSHFSKLKELLLLINAEVDTVDPDDISYVSSGYAPLTVRLVQSAVAGWRVGRDDILRELPGRFLDIVQHDPPEDLETTLLQRPSSMEGATYGSLALAQPPRTNKRKPVLIILYVGGVTYMELAAMRFLSRRPNFPYHIICLTTKIINGSTILESLSGL